MPTLKFEKSINAKPEIVFMALTNSTILRSWLCDVCTAEARYSGHIYFYWNSGYYAMGEFTAFEQNRSLAFTWLGKGEPGLTQVSVRLIKQRNGTNVKLQHKVPGSKKWQEVAEGFKSEWPKQLENLAYLLETGKDLRLANRPMLGIIPGDFTAEQAQLLGVPTADGLRLDGVVDGMGAQRSGLQRDDVLVGMAGQPIRNDFGSLVNAIAGKKGGDIVEVVFYRGPEKKSVQMELTRRPMPEVPFDAKKLAEIARTSYTAALADLANALAGVSDEVAKRKPAPGEWSALAALAHLVQSERGLIAFMTEIVNGDVRQGDGVGSNVEAYIEATCSAYPSVASMLAELHRTIDEVIAFIAALPKEFVANKALFYQLGFPFLQGQFHIPGHIEQIKAAITAAK